MAVLKFGFLKGQSLYHHNQVKKQLVEAEGGEGVGSNSLEAFWRNWFMNNTLNYCNMLL